MCKKEIPNGAIKCVHCDSFQNWRRYINFSNTLISLLVALISVSALATPIIFKAFKKDQSNVTVKLVGVFVEPIPDSMNPNPFISILISNPATKPGLVANLELLNSDSDPAPTTIYLNNDKGFRVSGFVVEPGSYTHYTGDLPIKLKTPVSLRNYILRVRIIQYDGSEKYFNIPVYPYLKLRTN